MARRGSATLKLHDARERKGSTQSSVSAVSAYQVVYEPGAHGLKRRPQDREAYGYLDGYVSQEKVRKGGERSHLWRSDRAGEPETGGC